MNPSTTKLVKESLANQNRHFLLATKVALLCKTHDGVQRVVDYFAVNGGTVQLACGCRRLANLRRPEDVAAYNASVAEAKRKTAGVPIGMAA
jgi:hypothetical protein